MRRLMARSRVLFPAPEGPTTAVTSPSGTSASTPVRISVPPAAYRIPRTASLGRPKLEGLPAQVGVEAIVERVGVARERMVVRQRELHAAHDGVQALGLGTGVLLVHQIGVVDYLGDLAEHSVLQLVVLQERLEGAVLSAVGEPGPDHVEELRTLRGLRGIAEEGEGGLGVYKAPDQPDAGGAVHVAASARGPQHQGLPSAPTVPADPSPSLIASRAALSACAVSPLSGERK